MGMLNKLFLILGALGFILALLGGNPFFSVYLFEIEPQQYAIFSIICLLFAITLLLNKISKGT